MSATYIWEQYTIDLFVFLCSIEHNIGQALLNLHVEEELTWRFILVYLN